MHGGDEADQEGAAPGEPAAGEEDHPDHRDGAEHGEAEALCRHGSQPGGVEEAEQCREPRGNSAVGRATSARA